MRCEDVRPLISEGLDEELDERRAAQVRAHLAGCAPCAVERAALDATVRLLHAVPEVDPPLELRRRIGVALHQEVQRRSERRSLLALLGLATPRRAGWTWGVALGAAAVVGLWATHAPAPSRTAAVPGPISPSVTKPLAAPPSLQTAAKPPHPSIEPHTTVAPPALTPPAPPGPLVAEVAGPRLPPVDASRPRVAAPIRVEPSSVPTPGSHPAVRRAPAASSPNPRPPTGSASHGSAPLSHPTPATRDMPLVASSQPMPSPTSTAPDVPDEELGSDTNGMTQMASGAPAPTAPAASTDDLDALRHRLTVRPLQVPELGQLKTGDRRSGHEGWIRF
jgi:hypothetical protein